MIRFMPTGKIRVMGTRKRMRSIPSRNWFKALSRGSLPFSHLHKRAFLPGLALNGSGSRLAVGGVPCCACPGPTGAVRVGLVQTNFAYFRCCAALHQQIGGYMGDQVKHVWFDCGTSSWSGPWANG